MERLPNEIQNYIDLVEKRKINVCKEQKQLVKLVKNAFKNEKLTVNYEDLQRYMSYQKYFPFNLFEWESFCFALHNCVFREDGESRWSDLFILCGRGAGKNGFLSFEGFCMTTNGIPQYDIDICATSEEQAKTSFDEIHAILENPQYRKRFKSNFKWTLSAIENTKTHSKIKYRTNNAKGKDGLRSGAVFFDEVHAYENWDNINVFTTGLGKKPQPRRTYVTTNGDVRDGVLDNMILKAQKILKGELPDNGFLPFICKLDNENEVDNIESWEKANPSLRYMPTLREQMLREYQDYKIDPVINCAFMTKRMNIPKGKADQEVTSWENILKTNREVPDLTGKTCMCGIDFTKTTDFMSAFLLFKQKETYYGIHHSWFCNRSNDKHRIKIPLNQMVERGLLTIVDDVEVHPHLVTDWIAEMNKVYDIDKVAIDSFRYALLTRELADIGFEAKEKKVKLVRPSDIMLIQPKINSMFATGQIVWGDDPLMRWFTNNAKLEPAQNNNYKYGKIEPKSRKTDGFMAFVAACTLESEIPEQSELSFIEPIIF